MKTQRAPKKIYPKPSFNCCACGKESMRGTLVQVSFGKSKGTIIKVCRGPDCIQKAVKGEV